MPRTSKAKKPSPQASLFDFDEEPQSIPPIDSGPSAALSARPTETHSAETAEQSSAKVTFNPNYLSSLMKSSGLVPHACWCWQAYLLCTHGVALLTAQNKLNGYAPECWQLAFEELEPRIYRQAVEQAIEESVAAAGMLAEDLKAGCLLLGAIGHLFSTARPAGG